MPIKEWTFQQQWDQPKSKSFLLVLYVGYQQKVGPIIKVDFPTSTDPDFKLFNLEKNPTQLFPISCVLAKFRCSQFDNQE